MPFGFLFSQERRLLRTKLLQNFVREKRGRWTEDEWCALVALVLLRGYDRITEERLHRLCGDNRERWLSGDNSVGPPPPGPTEEARRPVVVEARARRPEEGPAAGVGKPSRKRKAPKKKPIKRKPKGAPKAKRGKRRKTAKKPPAKKRARKRKAGKKTSRTRKVAEVKGKSRKKRAAGTVKGSGDQGSGVP